MSEPPIVQYWHEEEPPDYIAALVESFAEQNPGRPHLLFSERSATEFIGERLGERRLRAFRACGPPAMQADYLRYCAILALGGMYCDSDSRCVASLDSAIPPAGEGQLFQRGGDAVVNGFFAFGSPGHPFMELALDVATSNVERRSGDTVYMATGPFVFTSLYRLRVLGSFDALIEHLRGRPSLGCARGICEAVGDYARIEAAFQGVTVSPAEVNPWVRAPSEPLPYKETQAHWLNAPGSIYRSAP